MEEKCEKEQYTFERRILVKQAENMFKGSHGPSSRRARKIKSNTAAPMQEVVVGPSREHPFEELICSGNGVPAAPAQKGPATDISDMSGPSQSASDNNMCQGSAEQVEEYHDLIDLFEVVGYGVEAMFAFQASHDVHTHPNERHSSEQLREALLQHVVPPTYPSLDGTIDSRPRPDTFTEVDAIYERNFNDIFDHTSEKNKDSNTYEYLSP